MSETNPSYVMQLSCGEIEDQAIVVSLISLYPMFYCY